MIANRICFWCGEKLSPGGTAFQMHIQMVADFDGYIDADSPDNLPAAGLQAVQSADARTAEELMEEVYRERVFLFCSKCAQRAWNLLTQPENKNFSRHQDGES
jgi:hypothetical protein